MIQNNVGLREESDKTSALKEKEFLYELSKCHLRKNKSVLMESEEGKKWGMAVAFAFVALFCS